MHKSNWDDLRYVLAVAEHGSVNAAARAMGVNHATVLRRVSAFEEAHGHPVFDRSAQGYAVLPAQMDLIGAAREAAEAMGRVERMSRASLEGGRARIRVTSTDSLCTYLLPRTLPALVDSDVVMEIRSSNLHVELGRLRAEVTVRPAPGLPADLEGTCAAHLAIAAFAPATGDDGRWLGLSGPVSRVAAADWMAEHGADLDVAGAADSFLVLHQMVAAGAGRAFLPAFLGRDDPRLVPLEQVPGFSVPIWVASQSELADLPRLSRIRRRLCDAIGQEAEWLAGRAPCPGLPAAISG